MTQTGWIGILEFNVKFLEKTEKQMFLAKFWNRNAYFSFKLISIVFFLLKIYDVTQIGWVGVLEFDEKFLREDRKKGCFSKLSE